MPRPIALANGVYHLNIRVPSDLADTAKGTVVTLPINKVCATARVGDKVIVSLCTNDPAVAKVRFAEAKQALARHWTAIRSVPVTLSHKQCVAPVMRAVLDKFISPDMVAVLGPKPDAGAIVGPKAATLWRSAASGHVKQSLMGWQAEVAWPAPLAPLAARSVRPAWRSPSSRHGATRP